MISEVLKLHSDVLTVVLYTNSPSLQFFIKDALKHVYKQDPLFCVTVTSKQELTEIQEQTGLAPLTGGKWIVHIDADGIGRKDITAVVKHQSNNAINFVWTSNYGIYKQILDHPLTQKFQGRIKGFYFGSLGQKDIRSLYHFLVPVKHQFPKTEKKKDDLLYFVTESYKYNVQAIFELFNHMKQEHTIKNKQDIMNLVGIGGNSTDNLVITLLEAEPITAKKRENISKKLFTLLQDLAVDIEYRTISNYMMATLEGMIEMKELQIMGVFHQRDYVIPPNFNENRLNRLNRFRYKVLHEYTLLDILNLKLALNQFDDWNYELNLIRGIATYLDMKYVLSLKEAVK